ncbi:MAG: hypothetical protein IKU58_01440 [Clostridia bacterium]|nr:hypothetical protein [Clostridia bacterium]
MKKAVKLTLWLLLSAALLFFLWVQDDCPALSAEQAFHRMESRYLLPESRFEGLASLGYLRSGTGNYQRYLAAGVTDTHLHMAEVRKKALLWYIVDQWSGSIASVPLEGETTVGIAPDYWPFDYHFFCYTTLPAQQWEATVTVGDLSYTTEGTCGADGFTLFAFPQLENCPQAISDHLKALAYDLLGVGYNKNNKTVDISLSVALFDENGQPLGVAATEYPAS